MLIGEKNGKMMETSSGKIGTCPTVEYSPYDCCCFLDPSPANWSSTTTYQKNAAVFHTPPAWEAKTYPANSGVSHNGKIWHTTGSRTASQVPGIHTGWVEKQGTWYSTINGGNLNWEPGASGNYWMPYTHCNNEGWDSHWPFGGVGKTPQKYVFAVYGITVSNCSNCNDIIDFLKTFSLEDYPYPVIDPHTGNFSSYGQYCETNAYFGSESSIDGLWALNLSMTSSGKTKITISSGITPGLCDPAGIIFSGETDECTMSGTIANQYTVDDLCEAGTINGYGGIVSFRPLDCDYKKWDSTVIYTTGDCVSWNGKFYRACGGNDNLNHEPEADASNVCEVGYWWRLA